MELCMCILRLGWYLWYVYNNIKPGSFVDLLMLIDLSQGLISDEKSSTTKCCTNQYNFIIVFKCDVSDPSKASRNDLFKWTADMKRTSESRGEIQGNSCMKIMNSLNKKALFVATPTPSSFKCGFQFLLISLLKKKSLKLYICLCTYRRYGCESSFNTAYKFF